MTADPQPFAPRVIIVESPGNYGEKRLIGPLAVERQLFVVEGAGGEVVLTGLLNLGTPWPPSIVLGGLSFDLTEELSIVDMATPFAGLASIRVEGARVYRLRPGEAPELPATPEPDR